MVTTRLERTRLGAASALTLRGPRVLAGLAVTGAALPLAALPPRSGKDRPLKAAISDRSIGIGIVSD